MIHLGILLVPIGTSKDHITLCSVMVLQQVENQDQSNQVSVVALAHPTTILHHILSAWV